MSEVFEADRIRHDRWLEFGLFVAWHVAAFSNQKKLPGFAEVLSRFRGGRHGKPVQDWRLEKEQMAAMRESMSKREGATPRKKGTPT